jgi:hypothetical protein
MDFTVKKNMEEKISGRESGNADRDDAFDVYGVIRSEEIREYYRKEDPMGILEKEQLILHSYTSVEQKVTLLKELSRTCSKEESRMLDEMRRVYEKYIRQLRHPDVRTIFLLEYVEQGYDEGRIIVPGVLGGAFDTVEEVEGELTKIYGGVEEMVFGRVTVLQVPKKEKVKEAFCFGLFWIDGKWQVKDFSVREEVLKAQGVSADTVERFCEYSMRHPLPFENGCRLKLLLPFMKEPVYGILESEKDGNGCWYHFLNVGNESFDLSYSKIDLTSEYSSLDFIERA